MISYSIVLLLACTLAAGRIRPRLDGRIIGGHSVDIVDYPYQLSLQSYGMHICGASIIAEDWALTAAHCVEDARNGEITFRAGSTKNGHGGSIHEVDEIIVHPKYYDSDYDFALVRISDSFPIGDLGVDLIMLTDTEPSAGTRAIVSGWGDTGSGSLPSHLQAVDVHIVDRKKCNSVYGNISKRMICAADRNKDSCQGDSGGPLIDPSTNQQIGVVSWGYGCAEPGYPGVYSNIASVRSWIIDMTGV